MVPDKYAVRLSSKQREELQNRIRVGRSSARVTAKVRILLKSDDGWGLLGWLKPLMWRWAPCLRPPLRSGDHQHEPSYSLINCGIPLLGAAVDAHQFGGNGMEGTPRSLVHFSKERQAEA